MRPILFYMDYPVNTDKCDINACDIYFDFANEVKIRKNQYWKTPQNRPFEKMMSQKT